MDPPSLFPWLAVLFVALALLQAARTRRWRGAAAIWAWIALCFGAVSWWVQP